MAERRCPYCERVFQPSKYQPKQSVCGEPACQRRRRADDRQRRIATDAEYRQVCLDSAQNWRARNPDYWKRYREQHPAVVEQNRRQQNERDQKRRLRQLANNNSDLGLSVVQPRSGWWAAASAILQTTTQLPPKSGSCRSFLPASRPRPGLANNNLLVQPCFPSDNGSHIMLSPEQINDLHRLYWSERWSIRKIERHLHMGWRTIRKYLDAPAQAAGPRQRESKLDSFKSAIAEWLEKDPALSAAVIEQRLRPLGYQGGHSILRELIHKLRPQLKPSRAFLRMEPPPGERFEVDWGHFGTLTYSGDVRKLYAFALVDAHSRMLFVEFTHSQSFETFVRCHIHAFTALGGVARSWSSAHVRAFD